MRKISNLCFPGLILLMLMGCNKKQDVVYSCNPDINAFIISNLSE